MEDIKVGEYGLENETEGMYARTDNGIIGEILNSNSDEMINGPEILVNGKIYCIERNSIKDIKDNLIDLLETDDIVVLEYYVEKYRKRITRKFVAFKYDFLIKFNNIYCDFLYDLNEKKWTEEEYNIQIKQILTREQFEANCYKVKGE